MGDVWLDRENAMVNGIMSGDNACGALAKALEAGRLEGFLRRMLRPTLLICAGEARELRSQRDAALAESEGRRRTLAKIAANAGFTGRLAAEAERAARVR
jgi:hypothetical protein